MKECKWWAVLLWMFLAPMALGHGPRLRNYTLRPCLHCGHYDRWFLSLWTKRVYYIFLVLTPRWLLCMGSSLWCNSLKGLDGKPISLQSWDGRRSNLTEVGCSWCRGLRSQHTSKLLPCLHHGALHSNPKSTYMQDAIILKRIVQRWDSIPYIFNFHIALCWNVAHGGEQYFDQIMWPDQNRLRPRQLQWVDQIKEHCPVFQLWEVRMCSTFKVVLGLIRDSKVLYGFVTWASESSRWISSVK